MLTIAGAGINLYSLEELSSKVNWKDYDCLIADKNYNKEANNKLMPENLEKHFVSFNDISELIMEKLLENKKVLYVVSGSPLFYSATEKILSNLQKHNLYAKTILEIIPAESCRDYILRKLNIPEFDVTSISLHGSSPDKLDLTKFLIYKYTFMLCDENSLPYIADYIKYIGAELTIYLGSKLGSKQERIEKIVLADLINDYSLDRIKNELMPYVLLIKRDYNLPQTLSGDADYLTCAGMITKGDKRILTLQALKLQSNLVMWDIGAGSGSVSIEAYKLFKVRTFMFEKNPEQCQYIVQNLKNHKVAGAILFEGNVMDNFVNAPSPDRIFIGGGGKEVLANIPLFSSLLSSEGVLVANIIGLENLAVAIQTLQNTSLNYDVRSIYVINYKKIMKGSEPSLAQPDRAIFQVIVTN